MSGKTERPAASKPEITGCSGCKLMGYPCEYNREAE